MNWSPDRSFRSFILNKKSFAKIREVDDLFLKAWDSFIYSCFCLSSRTRHTPWLYVQGQKNWLLLWLCLTVWLTAWNSHFHPCQSNPTAMEEVLNDIAMKISWVVKHFKLLPETHKFTDETQIVHFHYQDSWICRKELIKL